jgi:hypothetical protein
MSIEWVVPPEPVDPAQHGPWWRSKRSVGGTVAMSRRSMLISLQALHFKKMLKTAGHEKKVKKVKVKETEVEPYKEAYEVSLHSGR